MYTKSALPYQWLLHVHACHMYDGTFSSCLDMDINLCVCDIINLVARICMEDWMSKLAQCMTVNIMLVGTNYYA